MNDPTPCTIDALVARIEDAIARAEAAGRLIPEGMALATVGSDGRPSVRTVLLKGADARGLVFYTNLGSRKSRDLAGDPRAALCLWWDVLQEQILVEGRCERVSDAEADAYFATRPRGSQLGAWASRQSEPLESREALEARVAEAARRFEGREVPRPPFWSGFRLVPERFEFWYGRPDRLHDRFVYTPGPGGWVPHRLHP